MSYLSKDAAYDYATLSCWYQSSIDETHPPIWTDEHLDELLNDFYVIPNDTPVADVAPKAEIAREIFEEIEKIITIHKLYGDFCVDSKLYTELKKKYTGEGA